MLIKQNIFWLLTLFILTSVAYFFGKSQQVEVIPAVGAPVVSIKNKVVSDQNDDWVDVYDKKESFTNIIEDLKKRLSKSNALIDLLSQTNSTKSTTLPNELLSSSEKIAKVVDQAADEEIDFYLDQYFPDDVLGRITNKRDFSKRLLEEFTSPAEPEKRTVHGQILFSTASAFPDEENINFSLQRRQTMVSHIETDGSLIPTDQVFIRWVRASDNKILLFKNVIIREASNRNWVTLKPKKDWLVGSYIVTIYSFEDALNVIAQGVYDVDIVE